MQRQHPAVTPTTVSSPQIPDPSALDPDSDVEGTAGSWVDRLVELRVLADHGDTAAAARAEQWISHDEAAGRMWRQMIRDCSLLGDPGAPR